VKVRLWALPTNQSVRNLGASFRHASRFGVEKILAIMFRTNSTYIAKDLRKVLLSFEAARHGNVQYSRNGEPHGKADRSVVTA
jgi:hypothetical protein